MSEAPGQGCSPTLPSARCAPLENSQKLSGSVSPSGSEELGPDFRVAASSCPMSPKRSSSGWERDPQSELGHPPCS